MKRYTSRFVAFDCETTGLQADARIVELAAARVSAETGAVLERWQTLVSQIEEVEDIQPGSVKPEECFTTEFLAPAKTAE